MDEPTTEYPVLKDQAQVDALLDALDMPPCQRCGAIVETRETPLCWPCTVGNKRAIWTTMRPRAAVFDLEPQLERYTDDLSTLNARGVRWRGLLVACLASAPAHLRAHIERELAAR